MRRPDGRRRARTAALLAVVGPGLLAGLSDDDPAGITTYSVLGAEYGYQLLWVLLVSTLALVAFHAAAVRLGVVTGQGLLGLIRDRYGARTGTMALTLLLVANVGTTAAEFAGIAAGLELFSVPRYVSVPLAAAVVGALVLRGSFHRVEHVLMGAASLLVAYIVAGLLVSPDWSAVGTGLFVPSMPLNPDTVTVVAATVGTTLAPWGLSFVQSYAVDKKLTPDALGYERADVVTGSVLTGVVGLFVVVTCAETLRSRGVRIESAQDAAAALEPIAGQLSSTVFAVGIVAAGLLAAAVVPLSTSYSLCEFAGYEAGLDDSFRTAPAFYVTLLAILALGAGTVLVPGVPLVPLLVLTQVLNAVLLLPFLVLIARLTADREIMGRYRSGRLMDAAYVGLIAIVTLAVLALATTPLW